MKDKTGGSAFPVKREITQRGVDLSSDGMTLRDYFAAKAMQSIILHSHGHSERFMVAKCAYQVADAMIAERS